jgi:hypothetical protein
MSIAPEYHFLLSKEILSLFRNNLNQEHDEQLSSVDKYRV